MKGIEKPIVIAKCQAPKRLKTGQDNKKYSSKEQNYSIKQLILSGQVVVMAA
jgi:hypothetical protein